MRIYRGFIIAYLFTACANPVSPTGGDKDVLPPIITSIQIDSLKVPKTITIQFDEYIKSSNDIVLNPQRKVEKKPTITPSLKSIQFSIPAYTRSINLTNSVQDLNENNLGLYPAIHLSADTLNFQRTINLNQHFQSQIKQFRLEKRIDTFYYRSYSIADTIYISGLPNTTTDLTAYLDANTNNTYDSTEWYSITTLDSNEAVHLFPPIINKIAVDTTHAQMIAIVPFYYIGGNLTNDSTVFIKNDTVIIPKKTFYTWINAYKYPLLYKKTILKSYLIKEIKIINADTFITYKPSLGGLVNPSSKITDTIKEPIIYGNIIFECDSLIRNTNLIILQKGKYHHHIAITQEKQTITLPTGDYNIITYIDRNHSGLFDAHGLSDSIIHYFDKIHVKPKLEHVIKLYKPFQNQEPSGGKNNPLIPVSLKPKNSVEQPSITPE